MSVPTLFFGTAVARSSFQTTTAPSPRQQSQRSSIFSKRKIRLWLETGFQRPALLPVRFAYVVVEDDGYACMPCRKGIIIRCTAPSRLSPRLTPRYPWGRNFTVLGSAVGDDEASSARNNATFSPPQGICAIFLPKDLYPKTNWTCPDSPKVHEIA